MIKKFIIKVFGRKTIEFLKSKPFVVHGKYRNIISDLDKYSNIIKNSYGSDPALSLLMVRKFGHILDKGLHRNDVEKGHSMIIAEELAKNIKIAENEFANDGTIQWAQEKLSIYNELQISGRIKPLSEEKAETKISYDDFYRLIEQRRSNRFFLNKQIENTIIEKLAVTVNLAPSSCNKQPLLIFASTNPAIAKDCLKCCKGGTGFDDFIPSFLVLAADMRGYYLPDEAFLPHIDAALGAQNIFLAAETLGLSACSLSWALKDKKDELRLRKLLSIPDYAQIILNFVLGYPSKNSVAPVRKSLWDTLFIRNE